MNFPSQGRPRAGVSPEIDPLNFCDIGYDITAAQVHADGEIWSATNYDIRQALVAKHDAGFPSPMRSSATARTGSTRQPVPGQPALGAAHVRRVPADAGGAVHARRPRCVPRRRPDALRRRQPARALAGVRQAWLREGAFSHEQQRGRERHAIRSPTSPRPRTTRRP